MRGWIGNRWRRVTLRRHRSELAALRLARSLGPPLPIFPIFLNLMLWWFSLGLPFLLAIPALSQTLAMPRLLSDLLLGAASLYAVVVLGLAAPWFFHWYFIAAGLMIGRTGMADQKEADLIAAIAANSRVN